VNPNINFYFREIGTLATSCVFKTYLPRINVNLEISYYKQCAAVITVLESIREPPHKEPKALRLTTYFVMQR
jgi:hypothetical protein